MTKWADYLISHVKKDSNQRVVHVLLHEDKGETVSMGVIKTKDEVITLLKKGKTVNTILWGYPNWLNGASVDFIKYQNGEYLRTDRNITEKDNLDNLISLYV
ncbi:DUF3892 domain-containing protein [Confluentibacter sediminis]|uniref:DUF3892 domain-containing protein n=1 Tax=Confluentibacter sediminis TaxID=2219045 RepID=UPI000DAEB281|nr:DUF3892 domain-containing protein [Confluentibacter sediminis]